MKNREIDKKIYILSSIFTKKQYYRPLLFNICLISIQQFSGNVSLMYKLQCVYGTILLSEMISTVTGTLVLQVLTYCYHSLSYIIPGIANLHTYESNKNCWLPFCFHLLYNFFSFYIKKTDCCLKYILLSGSSMNII